MIVLFIVLRLGKRGCQVDQFQRRQMLAFEKADDIRSGVMDCAVDFLHGISGFLDDTEKKDKELLLSLKPSGK